MSVKANSQRPRDNGIREIPTGKLRLLDPRGRLCFRLRGKKYEALKADIGRRGIINPLNVTEGNVVLAGHHRYRAAKELGFKTVPCKVVDPTLDGNTPKSWAVKDNLLHRDMDDSERDRMIAALRLAVPYPKDTPRSKVAKQPSAKVAERQEDGIDNKTLASQVGVCERTLRGAVRHAEDLEYLEQNAPVAAKEIKAEFYGGDEEDNRTGFGFKSAVRRETKRLRAIEEAKKQPKRSKTDGEATATVIKGDAFSCLQEHYGTADLIVTDPPYIISQPGKVMKAAGGAKAADFGDWDKGTRAEQKKLFSDIFALVSKLLKDRGSFYVFLDRMLVTYAWEMAEKHGLSPRNIIAWTKTVAGTTPRKNFVSAWEAILFGCKGEVGTWNGGGAVRNVLEFNPPAGDEKKWGHPTQKPVALLKRLVSLSSDEGGIVIDPFSGSGATGEAALQEKRTVVLCEQENKWVKVCKARVGFHNS